MKAELLSACVKLYQNGINEVLIKIGDFENKANVKIEEFKSKAENFKLFDYFKYTTLLNQF